MGDALIEAIERHDLEAVREALTPVVDVDRTRDEGSVAAAGETPLMVAARVGALDIAQLLLQRGADPSARSAIGRTALMAVALGPDAGSRASLASPGDSPRAALVRLLFEAGADLHERDSTSASALHLAAQASHGESSEVIRMLVDLGARVDRADDEGITPLGYAIAAQRLDAARTLLELGANPRIPLRHGHHALTAMAARGETEMVLSLLASGLGVNLPDRAGRTALAEAARAGHVELTRALLERRADPNAPDSAGTTALMVAAEWGSAELVDLLASRGARLDAADAQGRTALHHAAGNLDTAQILLARGADPRAADVAGRTPLHDAAATPGADPRLVDVLVDRGADPNAPNQRGETALHLAVQWHRAEVVERLLVRGANPDALDVVERTPLYRATRVSAVLDTLLAGGAQLDARDARGVTPLLAAIAEGHRAVAEWLLGRGAELGTRTEDGESALILALQQGHTELALALIAWGADPHAATADGRTPLLAACGFGLLDDRARRATRFSEDPMAPVVAALLERGADPNLGVLAAPRGGSALHLALTLRCPEVFELLLAHRADPNAADKRGESVLMRAARSPGAVRALLAHGVRVDATDRKDRTALHTLFQGTGAVDESWLRAVTESAELLLEAGASLDALDSEAATPLMRAVDRAGAAPLVEQLLRRGADPLLVNARRDAVLDIAIRRGDPAIVALIRTASDRARRAP